MKLKDGFLTHESDGETVVVDALSRFRGLARGNKTAGFILDCLADNTSESAIIDKMCDTYDAPREQISADVRAFLDKLRSIGALDE